MSLCGLCLSIELGAMSRAGLGNPHNPFEFYPMNHDLFGYDDCDWHSEDSAGIFFAYHSSLEALNSSAVVCGLCRLIVNCVDATLANMQKTVKLDYHHELSGYEFWLCGRAGADGFQVLGRHKNQKMYWLMGGIGFCVEDESPLSTVIQGRKIPPSPTSPAVLRKIEDWISKSREQLGHRSHQTNQGPTRILEIKENGSKVVLCELPSMQAEYSALSHCWGTLQPVTLTMDTLEDFRMGLKTSSLPETFQDAIWLANHLQIRYIWIDSLCIIQDCSDDWARESARMADIYGNSFLTIAACRSANTSNGFLNDRAERTYLPIPARLGNLFGEALAFTLPIKYAGNTRRCALLEGEPLTERGWAFQERYLARRTLHFGRSQIFFECDADFFPEDGCSYAQPLWSSEYILEDSSAGSSITCRQKWHRVIEQYSGRKLTLEDDKLPAVGGLAVRFALDSVTKNGSSILGNRYLAGLWWDNIIQDMCWRIETRKHSGERPRRYRAPTWSWASVNAVIEFFHTDTDLAVVQDAHVDLDTLENPLGRVIGGWIWLRALKFRAQGRTDSFLNHSLGLCEDGAEFSIDPDWDTDTYCAPKHGEKADHVKGETDLFVIPLAWLKGSWHSQPSPWSILGLFFLIVKAADHQVTSHVDMPGFQRVGSGTAHYTLDEGRREVLDLFVKKWTVAKERGELEDMIVL